MLQRDGIYESLFYVVSRLEYKNIDQNLHNQITSVNDKHIINNQKV